MPVPPEVVNDRPLSMRAGKLELKFAAQSGVSILPVKSEKGFQASSWLGIITAGKLWAEIICDHQVQPRSHFTALSLPCHCLSLPFLDLLLSQVDGAVPQLVDQIKKVTPTHERASADQATDYYTTDDEGACSNPRGFGAPLSSLAPFLIALC